MTRKSAKKQASEQSIPFSPEEQRELLLAACDGLRSQMRKLDRHLQLVKKELGRDSSPKQQQSDEPIEMDADTQPPKI